MRGEHLRGHRVVFLGKNPFFRGPSSTNTQPYLAGHTVGFTASMIGAMLERDARVTLITLNGPSNVPSDIAPHFPSPPDDERLSIIDVSLQTEPKVPFFFPSISIADHLLNLAEKEDRCLTVLAVYAYPAIVAAILAAREDPKRIRVVALLRGSDVSRFFGTAATGRLRIYRSALKSCHKVLAVSESLSANAAELGIPVHSVLPSPFLPVSPEMAMLKPGSAEARTLFLRMSASQCALPIHLHERPWTVSCARAGPERPINDSLGAFASPGLRDCTFGIVASPRAAPSSAVPDNVVSAFVPPSLMPDLLHATSVFLHPTRRAEFYDARPHAVTQAASTGCPVVLPKSAVEDGGAVESLSHINVQRLTYDDSQSLRGPIIADTCRSVFRDPSLAQRIRAENRMATADMSIASVGAKLTGLLRELHSDGDR